MKKAIFTFIFAVGLIFGGVSHAEFSPRNTAIRAGKYMVKFQFM